MNNKKCIKVKRTDYGYEIYEVTGEEERRLNPKAKIIMHKILEDFLCHPIDKDTRVYYAYDLIMQEFKQAWELSRPKKVNRNKSKQIIAGFLILITLTGTIIALANGKNQDETSSLNPDQAITVVTPKPSYGYSEETITHEFYYEFAKPNDREALINSQDYMKIYQKYEKMYGVDADLLCAIGAQESYGRHYSYSLNNGHATGIMGIENIWADANIKVFNFEKNAYETITVDYSKIGELEYNIKIGAAIFQNYFYNTLNNIDSIPDTNYMAYTLQKYNMGLGNMWKILSYGDNWMDNRGMIDAGDEYYIEHVLSRLDNGTVIKLRLPDGSYYNTKITNLSLEKHRSRS